MSFMDDYFGPLGEEYCVYFYVLAIFFGVMFAFSAVSLAFYMIMNIRKVTFQFVLNSAFGLLNAFLLYLVNRLMHTICVKAI